MKTKVCSKCGRELPVENFYSSGTSADGLFGHCKECHCLITSANARKRKGLPVDEIQWPKDETKAEVKPEVKVEEVHHEESPFMPSSLEPKVYSKFVPTLTDAEMKELEQHGLLNIAGRLLLNALRYKGYRGAVELVTVQKVVI